MYAPGPMTPGDASKANAMLNSQNAKNSMDEWNAKYEAEKDRYSNKLTREDSLPYGDNEHTLELRIHMNEWKSQNPKPSA